MAGEALRVLAVASKPDATLETAETGLTFLGLAGMIDPPRPEAKAAIQVCTDAGIRPIMITGDHPMTAQAVAQELGLLRNGGQVLTGAELEEMSEEQLQAEIENISVYAAGLAHPQAARGQRLAGARSDRSHDRRRCERCPGAQKSRYRNCDGHHRNGCDPGSRCDDVDR